MLMRTNKFVGRKNWNQANILCPSNKFVFYVNKTVFFYFYIEMKMEHMVLIYHKMKTIAFNGFFAGVTKHFHASTSTWSTTVIKKVFISL